jgi:hypothetical protein
MNNFNFIDEEHRKRFNKMCAKKDLQCFDTEYCAAFYILTSSVKLFEATFNCIDKDGIDTSKIKRMRYLSTTEGYMARIAIALFNSIQSLKLDFYWVARLNTEQYEIILEAFRIRRM